MTPQPMTLSEPQQHQRPEGYWAYGRYYGGWRRGKYMFPIDEEELNRLDIFHKFCLVARSNALSAYNLNLGRSARVLDLGTGTGIWAINVCDTSELIPEVMAVDLNRIQPNYIPRGMTTVQYDIEETTWNDLIWNCDFVHIRMLLGSIRDVMWTNIYRNAFQHLVPGTGRFEQVEIDWTPQWEDSGEVPQNSALERWADRFLAAMDLCHRRARVVPSDIRSMMEQAGFVDIQEQTIRCYVNPWSPDPQEQETARWFNMGLKHSLEALGLMPMVEKLGMTVAEVKDLCAEAVEENTKLRFHGYCTMHVWTARRPVTPLYGGWPLPT